MRRRPDRALERTSGGVVGVRLMPCPSDVRWGAAQRERHAPLSLPWVRLS